jgi:predicted RNA binding protein YcfA (HicA-like mRNA interferase family)
MGRRPESDCRASAAGTTSDYRVCIKLYGKLGNISGKEAVKAFQKAGWLPAGQVGSLVIMIKPGVRVNLSIPQHKELAVGTLQALIRHAGLTVDEFVALL